jgi:hypothetical protein
MRNSASSTYSESGYRSSTIALYSAARRNASAAEVGRESEPAESRTPSSNACRAL